MSSCWIFAHDIAEYGKGVCGMTGTVCLDVTHENPRIFTSMKEAVITARILGLDGFTIIGRCTENSNITNLYRKKGTRPYIGWLRSSPEGWLVDHTFID